MSVKKYLEPDLLGKIQLVPQLPLREGRIEYVKKVKLNEQGTPNISSEITLNFENGSKSSQFGRILKSEAKPIVH